MIKHLEIKTYEYCGVNVAVKLDYNNGTVSLIEDGHNLLFKDKHWVFAGRTEDYKNGWLNILEAMKYAIEEAFNEVKTYREAKFKEKEEDVMNALDIATDLIKKQKHKITKKSDKIKVARI
jgi:hypothetical protein